MSMMVSFCAVLFPRDVLDEILNFIESVSEGFPTYSCILCKKGSKSKKNLSKNLNLNYVFNPIIEHYVRVSTARSE